MNRKIAILTLVLTCALTAPLFAQQPFGSFGGQVGGGNSGAGVIPLHGWALDDDGVAWVDILVDGLVVGRARYGRSRPNVPQGFPDSDAAGFAYELDTTRFLNGLHTVSAQVTSETGETALLNNLRLEFINVTHNLRPFGRIDFPNADAELYGRCDLNDERRYSVVSGYALDVGVETGDQGVGYVELLIDGAIYANSQIDCHFDPLKGGQTDCYGLRRLDVARIYPNLSDGPHSGFRFVLDVGALINFGFVPGRHVLTVRSGDISGQVAEIAEIPVTFFCDEFLDNENAIGRVFRPRNGLIHTGVVEATGWALDMEEVFAVRVYVDGFYLGDATYGLPRPGINMKYPGFPDSLAPGWTFSLDTTQLSDGLHELQVIVVDNATPRGETLIGEKDFVVLNP